MARLDFGNLTVYVLGSKVHLEIGVPGSPEGVIALELSRDEFRRFVKKRSLCRR